MSFIEASHKDALIEAFDASVSLLPLFLRQEFLIVGGTAMLLLDGTRQTNDVNFLATPAALTAFFAAAALDARFTRSTTTTITDSFFPGPNIVEKVHWCYTTSASIDASTKGSTSTNEASSTASTTAAGINIPLAFLTVSRAFAPLELPLVEPVRAGFRPMLGELAKMKASAYMSRERMIDVVDLALLFETMDYTGEGFVGLEFLVDADFVDLSITAVECGQEHVRMLMRHLNLAGL